MRKIMKVILVGVIALACFGILMVCLAQAGELTGKFGLGVNLPGIQVRYGITDKTLVEGKIQFGSKNFIIGGRGYYLMEDLLENLVSNLPQNIHFLPYAGAEFDWIVSSYLKGGMQIGGFTGIEVLVTKNIGVSADIGLYILNIWSSKGSLADLGLVTNIGVTYYF